MAGGRPQNYDMQRVFYQPFNYCMRQNELDCQRGLLVPR